MPKKITLIAVNTVHTQADDGLTAKILPGQRFTIDAENAAYLLSVGAARKAETKAPAKKAPAKKAPAKKTPAKKAEKPAEKPAEEPAEEPAEGVAEVGDDDVGGDVI